MGKVLAWGALAVAVLTAGCSSSSPSRPALAAPPPKDDGKPAEGGKGGSAHAAALEQLKISKVEGRADKQNSIKVPLPDAANWMRVKFWGVPSLVGFRYGKDHHALVAAFITHVDDNSVQGACAASFEAWAKPWLTAFDVDIRHDTPVATMWNRQVIDVDSVLAKTATLASHESFAAAYGTYPAWKGACLVVGVAIPGRDEEPRALEVRDRFAREILPRIEVIAKEEPKERY